MSIQTNLFDVDYLDELYGLKKPKDKKPVLKKNNCFAGDHKKGFLSALKKAWDCGDISRSKYYELRSEYLADVE